MRIDDMKIIEKYLCSDKYEKEKLCRLFSIQKDQSFYILDVMDVIENEIIIMLRDKSCHSVTMKNNLFALNLSRLITDIKHNKRKFIELINSPSIEEVVIISISN